MADQKPKLPPGATLVEDDNGGMKLPPGATLTGVSPGEEGYEAARNPYGNPPPQDTIVGGLFRRGVETTKGIYHTVTDSPSAEETKRGAITGGAGELLQRPALVAGRVGRGIAESEKEAGRQTVAQFRQARQSPDVLNKPLGYARAAVTGLSMLDPFATGAVTNVNKLQDEGRNREAIGSGTFDVLTLLAGKKVGSAPSEAKTLSKLAYATDVQDFGNLTRIMPELRETIAQTGKPGTVQELGEAIKNTSERLDQRFNAALTRIANDPIVPDKIADALEAKARSLPRTAAAEAQSLLDEARQYRQPWTIRELNAERMYRNGLARGFENKGGVAQMGAMRSNSQNMIDKIAADTARDVLYDYMEQKFPGGNFRELKQTQSAILDMSDHLADHVDKIVSASQKKTGAPFRSKVGISAVMSPSSGPHPFLHAPLTGGPLGWANTSVRTAFGPTAAATTRRAAILAMPLSEFVTQTEEPNIPKTPGEAKERVKQFAPQ